ncbi:hypothetical protein D3C75_606310 [compost metagenome]
MTVNVEQLRKEFEAWVMSTEHKPYGWLGKEWLDRHEDSYADDYVHGLWTAYRMCMSLPPKVVNATYEWTEFDRHDPQKRPELGVEVLVRYKKPWPSEDTVAVGAVLDKPWEDDDFLGWYNGRGEVMSGLVTHWMPMIDVVIRNEEKEDNKAIEG